MVITDVNLQEIVEQYSIVPKSSIDQFSLTLHLSRIIKLYNFRQSQTITYGDKIGEEDILTKEISNEYLSLIHI